MQQTAHGEKLFIKKKEVFFPLQLDVAMESTEIIPELISTLETRRKNYRNERIFFFYIL